MYYCLVIIYTLADQPFKSFIKKILTLEIYLFEYCKSHMEVASSSFPEDHGNERLF